VTRPTIRPTWPVALLLIAAARHPILADDDPPPDPQAVAIDADFPGGNAKVTANAGDSVHVEPDLRGDRPWFYWYFEATALRPGRVYFTFPTKVIGMEHGAIGNQGPAISTDGGSTWDWAGTQNVDGSTFHHEFTKTGEAVRFAVTIPYLQADLAAFLKANVDNPHLVVSELTKSNGGRSVELLRIGEPGEGRQPVLVTGRHHAVESIASFVLEGFLAAAMSDTPAGREFREKYVLYAVPFVDKDGVEEGDQGKNRQPHDHNRDYGDEPLYAEVRAVKALDARLHFRYALDFHCPTLVLPDHQVMYFVGAKRHPAYNLDNVTEFAKHIRAGLPEDAPHGPLVWLRDEDDRSPKSSRYFGFNEGVVMSATFEFPFAPPTKKTDPASCRRYGEVILGAWVQTRFVAPDGT
jgi:hypothetical protein